MVVQHNMSAMNANRMLSGVSSAQSKSTEKLSSGYRINRAADDAAGLTISEKMRKQIKGLDQASTNAQDGVSAVQTAEGALTEVHSMLQRMNELAVQASNGTNAESDRQAIQDEINQLTTEIDRVAETTKFNETYLLKGDTTSKFIKVGAHDAGFAGKLTDNGDGTSSFVLNDVLAVGDKVQIAGKNYTIKASDAATDYIATTGAKGQATAGDTVVRDGKKIVADGNTVLEKGDTWYKADGTIQTVVSKDYAAQTAADAETALKAAGKGDKVKVNGTEYTIGTATDKATNTYTVDDLLATIKHMDELEINGAKTTYIAANTGTDELTIDQAYNKMVEELTKASSIGADEEADVKRTGVGEFKIKQGTVSVKDTLSFNLHVGADADTTNKITVDIDAMSAAGLGIKGIKVDTESNATYAIDAIADAVAKVSSQRSALGAVQNRLEHTIDNLDNVVENTTSAESRIRDTDMAEEMVNYSKNNILAQAGQSMLAQANQSTQGVLSLLQ